MSATTRRLSAATNRRFHAKLGASEVLGLQVVESTDNANSNIIMAVHWEVTKYAAASVNLFRISYMLAGSQSSRVQRLFVVSLVFNLVLCSMRCMLGRRVA